jgi:uncharacterized membrane protein YfcA
MQTVAGLTIVQALAACVSGAIGSNLAIVFLPSAAAFLGKAFTGQIEWLLAVPIVQTVPMATQLESKVSRRVPVGALRITLAVVIIAAAIHILSSVILLLSPIPLLME